MAGTFSGRGVPGPGRVVAGGRRGVGSGRPVPGSGCRRTRTGGPVIEEVGGWHEEQVAWDGGGEVEDSIVVARRLADEHIREHLLDHVRSPRIADEVGAEFAGADPA